MSDYRYEAVIRVDIAAAGLDKAWAIARRLGDLVQDQEGVVRTWVPMGEIEHRPDFERGGNRRG